MVDTIIFDLDGTLLDTLEDLTDSVNYAMERFGLPTHTLDAVRGFVGN
ncbi:MAG: HAD hydrolase-like protein, partial [Lachnospiraceae bacterium]|nr:HAD hydrolase-like protein [Lachnospiraceae bacterium]